MGELHQVLDYGNIALIIGAVFQAGVLWNKVGVLSTRVAKLETVGDFVIRLEEMHKANIERLEEIKRRIADLEEWEKGARDGS